MQYRKAALIFAVAAVFFGLWRYYAVQRPIVDAALINEASVTTAEDVFRLLRDAQKNVRTQKVRVSVRIENNGISTNSGLFVVYFKAPNKIRIEDPWIGSDGEKLWFYFPGDNQAMYVDLDELASVAPQYDLRAQATPESVLKSMWAGYSFVMTDVGGTWQLKGFSPKMPAQYTLEVSKNPVRLTRIIVELPNEPKAEVSLQYEQENIDLSDSLFLPPSNAIGTSTDWLPWNLLARAAAKMQDYETAIRLSEKALALVPSGVSDEVANLYMVHGGFFFLAHRYNEALECYTQALEKAVSSDVKSEAYFWRGAALTCLRRHEEAIVSYQKALEGTPDGPFAFQAYEYMGQSLRALSRYKEAAAAFRIALERAPAEDKHRIQRFLDTLPREGTMP